MTAGYPVRQHDGLQGCPESGRRVSVEEQEVSEVDSGQLVGVAIRSVSSASLSAKSTARRWSPSLPSTAATRANDHSQRGLADLRIVIV
jgi:hypothetical protein